MSSRLEQIVATHRAAAAADDRFVGELLEIASDTATPPSFRHALEIDPGVSVIAEIKRKSPSVGDIRLSLDPGQLAKEYASAGASCLSVLTDSEFFGGSVEDLQQATAAASLPALRKDFTVTEADIVDARIMGASAVLLIVSVLEDDELWRFGQLAERLELTALFEVHDEDEIERAVRADAKVIGVNQRDLHTFEIDRERATALAGRLPAGVVKIAESGIESAEDIRRLAAAGYDAALVGSSLLQAESPALALRSLVEAGRR